MHLLNSISVPLALTVLIAWIPEKKCHSQEVSPADSAAWSGLPEFPAGLIERTAESFTGEQEGESLSEEIADTEAGRVDLNRTDVAGLEVIPFLDATLRKNLVDYVATYGDVLSCYELLAIPGFDSALINRLRPCLRFTPQSGLPPVTPANLARYGRHNLMIRGSGTLPAAAGYSNGDDSASSRIYPGSPVRLNFRYTYSWFGKLAIGLAGEKDPGEQFFRGAQRNGMDFYAGYLALNDLGVLKNLTIGNFRVTFGQGLTLGTGRSPAAMPGFSASRPQPAGIRPSLGMTEGSYFRGVSATVKIPHFEISALFSRHPRDATVARRDTGTGAVTEISAWDESGYHRTAAELARRNTVRELVAGCNLTFRFSAGQRLAGRIGITGVYSRYSAEIAPEKTGYNRFAFRGTQNLNTGLEWRIRWRGAYLFGEMSRSMNGGMACVAGISVSPASSAMVSLLSRNYSARYHGLYSACFGQGSRPAGEQGLCLTVSSAIVRGWALSGFADLYTYTEARYRLDRPGPGMEAGAMVSAEAAPQVTVSIRWTFRRQPENAPVSQGDRMHRQVLRQTTTWRAGLDWVPLPGFRFRSRIEMKRSGLNRAGERAGYLAYQEVQQAGRWAFGDLAFRWTLFDIPEYDLRIYSWEPGVPYTLSVPATEGRGMKFALLLKVKLIKKADLWLRAGLTRYTGRDGSGTGADRTAGNLRSELTGQLMIRL